MVRRNTFLKILMLYLFGALLFSGCAIEKTPQGVFDRAICLEGDTSCNEKSGDLDKVSVGIFTTQSAGSIIVAEYSDSIALSGTCNTAGFYKGIVFIQMRTASGQYKKKTSTNCENNRWSLRVHDMRMAFPQTELSKDKQLLLSAEIKVKKSEGGDLLRGDGFSSEATTTILFKHASEVPSPTPSPQPSPSPNPNPSPSPSPSQGVHISYVTINNDVDVTVEFTVSPQPTVASGSIVIGYLSAYRCVQRSAEFSFPSLPPVGTPANTFIVGTTLSLAQAEFLQFVKIKLNSGQESEAYYVDSEDCMGGASGSSSPEQQQ